MEKLLQLIKDRLSVLPEYRRLNSLAGRNQLTQNELRNFESIENNYFRICDLIEEEKRNYINKVWGVEMLQKWEERKELIKNGFQARSEVGMKVETLTNELKDILDAFSTNGIEYN